ncbi:hypothetical protein HYV49_04880 [Candidatus Pacearchaeota archaeon]|nr:hypothetical protein [Candidatus Pacearchaeota archaeon]
MRKYEPVWETIKKTDGYYLSVSIDGRIDEISANELRNFFPSLYQSSIYYTPKQLEMMKFIQNYRGSKGFSPTLEEMAQNFDVTKITIWEHLNQLEKKGVVKRDKNKQRSIIPLDPRFL